MTLQPGATASLGILGGTFDPPHIGHLIAAQDVRTALSLDRMLFVPAAEPPHKRGQVVTPAPLRLEMLRSALTGVDGFDASDIELRRAGPSYSVDTLRALGAGNPGARLFFVIGADQFRELHTWHAPEEVARLARLVVMHRDNLSPEDMATPLDVEYETVRVTRVDVSSTLLRRRVKAHEPIRFLVPAGVEEIIRREGLYAERET
ncbi:MAG: nicotinate-nucleotide adenylyltransferase [Gemmatimonadota bacterium]